MISICRTIGDPLGNIDFNELPTTEFGPLPARVSRAATLDGGAVIAHYGVSHGDRTFYIKASITTAQKITLEYIHRCNETLILSCKEGFFLGVIETMTTAQGSLTMKFLVKEKLA